MKTVLGMVCCALAWNALGSGKALPSMDSKCPRLIIQTKYQDALYCDRFSGGDAIDFFLDDQLVMSLRFKEFVAEQEPGMSIIRYEIRPALGLKLDKTPVMASWRPDKPLVPRIGESAQSIAENRASGMSFATTVRLSNEARELRIMLPTTAQADYQVEEQKDGSLLLEQRFVRKALTAGESARISLSYWGDEFLWVLIEHPGENYRFFSYRGFLPLCAACLKVP
jgi:hypothetical protein